VEGVDLARGGEVAQAQERGDRQEGLDPADARHDTAGLETVHPAHELPADPENASRKPAWTRWRDHSMRRRRARSAGPSGPRSRARHPAGRTPVLAEGARERRAKGAGRIRTTLAGSPAAGLTGVMPRRARRGYFFSNNDLYWP